MPETVRVNFSRPLPLFPLADTVLLPHAVLPLHIFEARYRQMVSRCLDQAGQLAIGTIDGRAKVGSPTPVRSAACVGQIIQHDALPDGRYNILLHGVCRARIQRLIEPDDERTYRLAVLAPLEPVNEPPTPMPGVREELRRILRGRRLQRLRAIDTLKEWTDREDVPTHALLELIGFALVRDTERKYQLLAEPDAERRADIIRGELQCLRRLVQLAEHQSQDAWPKGMSWN